MWAVIELCIIAAIVLISITEFFIPLLFNKPLFGSFRKAKPKAPPVDESLTEKISKAKEKVEEVKEVQEEVDENFNAAEELKEKSDNLLK